MHMTDFQMLSVVIAIIGLVLTAYGLGNRKK